MSVRVDRYTVMLVAGVPALLVTLTMLARTELVIGDTVRRAVASRAASHGADVEVLTVSPSGLWSIELEQVSARIPRGDFAIEAELESVVITPSLGALLAGDLVVDAVEVRNGAVAWVPWESKPAESARRSSSDSSRPEQTGEVQTQPPVDVSITNVDFVAYSELYQVRPLHLGQLEFEWVRGEPIREIAGYGTLPDRVAFAIVADGAAYRLQPQTRTRIDRWVAPRGGGVAWPVTISTRDVRLCLDCESLVALEDVEIGVPRWRDDVRLTAPTADVWRRGGELGLRAPEMAIVDAQTDDFAARLTRADLRYATDTGRLRGAIELADSAGGLLGVTWEWDATDFEVDFDADGFQLRSIWHLVGLGDFARPGRIDGEAEAGWDVRLQTVGFVVDLQLDELAFRNPWTDEVYDFHDGRFELDVFFDVRGRALSIRRAALTVGQTRPMEAKLLLVEAGSGLAFEGEFEVARQDAAALVRALPPQLTDVLDGAELEGSFGMRVSAVGHSAFPEGLVLSGELDTDVEVVREGKRADVSQIGRSGPPPGFSGDWTPLATIGRDAWEIVLAAEDTKFLRHDGFDWAGIERAMVHNLRVGRPERGGSTISQQVAKNLYLGGERTLSRKLQEAYLTWRLEEALPKKRILEIYLNIAEWGPGVRGIAAAAAHYFDRPPRQLEVSEVALLAAILPNPHRFGRLVEQGKLASSRLEKFEHVLRNLRYLDEITPTEYRRWWRAAQQGRIGRLELDICADEPDDVRPRCPSGGS